MLTELDRASGGHRAGLHEIAPGPDTIAQSRLPGSAASARNCAAMTPTGGEARADDARIVELVRAGDREAFAILVDRYQKMVFALSRRMTGNPEDAADVVQTTFLKAFRQLDRFRGEASFKTWLYGIALNECRMLYRKSGRTVELDAIAEPAAPPAQGHPLDRVTLNKMVTRLPDKQRAALVLRVCEDLAFRDIGKILGTSEASAKVNYFHAIKKLRRWIDPSSGTRGEKS